MTGPTSGESRDRCRGVGAPTWGRPVVSSVHRDKAFSRRSAVRGARLNSISTPCRVQGVDRRRFLLSSCTSRPTPPTAFDQNPMREQSSKSNSNVYCTDERQTHKKN